MSVQSKSAKKTIYIDPEDEITAVIDKVSSADQSIIALVIPKRAPVFSSIVNMKLLKRAASQNGKNLVLVTSAPAILPLAGAVGLHVASNPNAKPYIPEDPSKLSVSDGESGTEETIKIDNSSASKGSSSGSDKKKSSDNKTAKAESQTDEPAIETPEVKPEKAKKQKKPKVPNFNRFRKMMIVGAIVLAALISGLVWAIFYAPRATVALNAETTVKALNFNVDADTSVQEVDTENSVLPAVMKEIKKTETAKVAASGQRDKGNKASGSVTMRNCSDNDVVIPAGTGVSANNLTFITQSAVSLGAGDFTSSGQCKPSSPSKEVDVIAQEAGDKYNISSRSFTVSGASGIRATGSDMTGGTSQIVKVVTSGDIESAKRQITDQQNGVADQIAGELSAQDMIVLKDTFVVTNGEFSATPSADSEANEAVVTVNATYSMLGIKKSDLRQIVEAQAYKNGVDKDRQSIIKDGIDGAVYKIGATTKTSTSINVSVNVEAGPQLDHQRIKDEIKGKKSGEAEQIMLKWPGIKEARVETSPFWNSKIPGNTNRITITVNGTDQSDQNDQTP